MNVFSILRLLQAKGGRRRGRPVSTPKRRHKASLRVEALEARQLLSCNTTTGALVQTDTCPTISGYVYSDANDNGIMDAGETGIANAHVALKNANGTVVATAVTDASGHYLFSQDNTISTAGTTQSFTLNFNSRKTNWSLAQALQQFNPALGTLTAVDITTNGTLTSQVRVENLDSDPSTITANVNGTLALTGPGLNQSPLTLSPSQGAGASGFSFDADSFDGIEDFAGTSGHDFGPRSASSSQTVTLSDPASLAAYIGTGTVSLKETAHVSSSVAGSGNLLARITSNAGATVTVTYHYTPDNCLQPGNYTIVQTDQPAGYLDGQNTSGNTEPIPDSTGSHEIPVTLGSTDSTANNFGKVLPASVSGFVYVDANNNGVKDPGEAGIANTTITLSGVDDTGNILVVTQKTAADGSYNFTGLRPGDYSLKETQPGGYLDGQTTAGSLGGTAEDDQITDITLNPADSSTNNNFGELQPAKLSGFVYVDANDNGAKDPGETGIGGVTVNLAGTDDQGNPVQKTTTTASDGSYSFTGLRAGNYQLSEVQPTGYFQGKNSVGNQGGQLMATDQMAGLNLAFGQTGANNNFGELLPASVGGFVYVDANNNGVKDPGETPIGNVAVALTGTNDLGQSVRLNTTTAADGSYSFGSLRPGNYTVTETQPAGYLQGKDTVGSLGGTTANDQFFINLAQGNAGVNYNFGELLPPSQQVTSQANNPPPQTPPPPPSGGVLTKRDSLLLFWQRRGLFGW